MATILITGATDGIGLSLARLYADRGHRLILLGRRALDELDDPLFSPDTYCRADLAEADAVQRTVAWLRAHDAERLDLLVHNAGTGFYGEPGAQSAASVDAVLTVNFFSPVRLTRALYPWLLAAKGKVVFVSSVVTALPTPDYAVYGASKGALEGFARSLRVEWDGRVTVQVVRPGATRSGMHAKIGLTREVMDWERFPSADAVALQMLQAIEGKRPVVTLGAANRLLGAAGRWGRPLLDALMRRPADAAMLAATRGKGRPRCLVTGFADGIGRAVAERFARAGCDIIGIDVDQARAEETAAALRENGADVAVHLVDLTVAEEVDRLLADLAADGRLLDVVVHNAGISAVGRFEALSLPAQEPVALLNLYAPLRLTTGFLREGLVAPGARFVFLSSLSFFSGYPGAAVYGATKDGIANYARSLHAASRAWRTVTVFPGPTRTAHARRYSPDNSREGRRMPPETVADHLYRGVVRGRTRVIPGGANRVLALVGRLAPRLLERAMRRTIYDLLPPDGALGEVGGDV